MRLVLLSLICCSLLVVAGCRGATQPPSPRQLEGTYVAYTFNSFKRYIFSADGTFRRGAAASGMARGVDHAAPGDIGSYRIHDDVLELILSDGSMEVHGIKEQAGEDPLTTLLVDGERFTKQN